MILNGNDLEADNKFECDICILGGGVAGIVLANELKNTFKKIIIIESGDEQYTQEAQDLYAPEEKPRLHRLCLLPMMG